MIHWPAILKHDGEDELIYIQSLEQWQSDEEMYLYIFTDRDVLIDSRGQVISLTEIQQDINTTNTLAIATTDNLIELVQAHAAITGACCIEKIQASSVTDAIMLVSHLQQS